MITRWTLPQQQIRKIGTTAADLFELLLILAVDGIVRGLTITRLTGRYNSEFSDTISDRTTNAQIKRLADHGLIEIERYTRKTKDADLQRRGDVRIRVKKTEFLQSKVDFDVGARIGHEVRNETRCEPRPDVKTAPIVKESPPIVQKPPERHVPQTDCSQNFSFSSLCQEHQEQEKYLYPQEQSRNQKHQETGGAKSAEPIDDPVLRAVAEKIGPERFGLWLGSTTIAIADDCVSVVVTKNQVAANWINENMLDDLVKAFAAVTGRRRRVSVSFQQTGKPPISAKPPEKPKEARTSAPPPLWPKSQCIARTPRRSETGGPAILADALKPAIGALVEFALPSGDLFRTMKMINLRDKLKKYYDLEQPEARQALCRVVVCAVELNQHKRLKDFIREIERGTVRDPAAYLGKFCNDSLRLCNKTRNDIDEIGRENGVGKGLWKGKMV